MFNTSNTIHISLNPFGLPHLELISEHWYLDKNQKMAKREEAEILTAVTAHNCTTRSLHRYYYTLQRFLKLRHFIRKTKYSPKTYLPFLEYWFQLWSIIHQRKYDSRDVISYSKLIGLESEPLDRDNELDSTQGTGLKEFRDVTVDVESRGHIWAASKAAFSSKLGLSNPSWKYCSYSSSLETLE